MKKTIYLKFILAYALFAVFGFIVVATFVSNMTMDQVRQRTAASLYREATTVANTYAAELYSSETSLDSVYKQLSSLGTFLDARIMVLNPSGRVVVDSQTRIDPETEVRVEGFDPSVFSGNLYVEGTFFGYCSEDQLSVLAPITRNYKTNGYVVIHMPLDDLWEEANHRLNISYIELLILLLLSLIVLIFFTEIVYLPLRRITRATEQYAAGNMHYELTAESDDEIGYLAASLRYMARKVADSEDDQKKFIANVSHDFRSPLTSIRGFLQAMLDGTIPPQMYDRYIRLVLDETERLTKLTNDLLALNNLNTRGMMLNRTDYDINDVIRRVAASFEQTCLGKDVTLELILTGDVLYVNADRDRIQQVLYNLLDNAIKFSKNNTCVRIETSVKHHKVFVSVKDHGIGIPIGEQNAIFDRFYKTDLSRGKDKKGTGLGLSIVREILRAHNENINVISTEGVGSEFIFSLQRSDLNDSLDD